MNQLSSTKISDPPIKLRGHDHDNGTRNPKATDWLAKNLKFEILLSKPGDGLQKALAKSKKSARPVPFQTSWIERCPNCGDPIEFEALKGAIQTRTECKFKKGMKPLVFEIPIPSGRMAIANDLRHVFHTHGASRDINYAFGQRAEMARLAKQNLAYLFSGNSCPSIFEMVSKDQPHTQFAVGKVPQTGDWKRKASVCTDLWAACIADANLVEQSCKSQGIEPPSDMRVIPCKPGTYQITYLGHNNENLYDFTIALINWKKEKTRATPNPHTEYLKQNFTIQEVAHAAVSNRRYIEEKQTPEQETQRFLNQMFFTLGNGVEWHPNGWASPYPMEPCENPRPAKKLAKLTRAFSWYPISSYSVAASLAGIQCKHYASRNLTRISLNPSFLSALIDCLENIVRYGVKSPERGNAEHRKSETQEARQTKSICKAIIDGLAQDLEHGDPCKKSIGVELVQQMRNAKRLQDLAAKYKLAHSRETYLVASDFGEAVHQTKLAEGPGLKNVTVEIEGVTGEKPTYRQRIDCQVVNSKNGDQIRNITLSGEITKHKNSGESVRFLETRYQGILHVKHTSKGVVTTWKEKGGKTETISTTQLKKRFEKVARKHRKPNASILLGFQKTLKKEEASRTKFRNSRIGKILLGDLLN
jgi:hypothetical protein